MSNVYKYLKESQNSLKIILSKENSKINIFELSTTKNYKSKRFFNSKCNDRQKKHTHTHTHTHICKINMTILSSLHSESQYIH